MAYKQADLDLLQSNIAKGITTSSIGGETLVFRTLEEMERLERKIKRELAAGNGTPLKRQVHRPTTSLGFRD